MRIYPLFLAHGRLSSSERKFFPCTALLSQYDSDSVSETIDPPSPPFYHGTGAATPAFAISSSFRPSPSSVAFAKPPLGPKPKSRASIRALSAFRRRIARKSLASASLDQSDQKNVRWIAGLGEKYILSPNTRRPNVRVMIFLFPRSDFTVDSCKKINLISFFRSSSLLRGSLAFSSCSSSSCSFFLLSSSFDRFPSSSARPKKILLRCPGLKKKKKISICQKIVVRTFLLRPYSRYPGYTARRFGRFVAQGSHRKSNGHPFQKVRASRGVIGQPNQYPP